MSDSKKTPDHKKDGGIFRCIPARFVVGTMCFLGITLQYTAKVALSVAIVAMVHRNPGNSSDSKQLRDAVTMSMRSEDPEVCPGRNDDSDSQSQEGEFDWDEATQGIILSAYFYGYITTQFLGGRLSELFGTRYVLGPGVLIAGLLTLLSPMAARLGVGAFIADRVLVGAASGLVIPAMNNVLPTWFVEQERSFFGSYLITGIPVGTIIAMTLSGVLASAGGWPLVFYFFGGILVAFIVPWMLLFYDSPEKHPRISEKEKNFILSETGCMEKPREVTHSLPWLSFLTSVPLWAHVLMGLGNTWTLYIFLSELPTYLSNILHFNLEESAALSAMPYIFGGVGNIVFGYISQWLVGKGYCSKLTSYRIMNTIGAVGPAVGMLAVTFVGCDSTVILVLVVFTLTTLAAYQGGSFINHVDLASNYNGTLGGIHYTILNVAGVLAPTVTGAIINEQQKRSRWKIVFYVSIAVTTVPWLFYLFFGSTKEQSWNELPPEKKKSESCSQDSRQRV